MSFERFSTTSSRHGRATFSGAVILGACLLAGACVATKPIDGDPRCPCAPGWVCSADTLTCAPAPNLERGGHDGGVGLRPEVLHERGLIKKAKHDLVILGTGEVSKSLNISAHRFTKTAREKIAAQRAATPSASVASSRRRACWRRWPSCGRGV